jgi:hypothetical protein
MEQRPAEGWPDGPLTEAEARDLLGGDVVGVWVMDHDENTRAVMLGPDAPEDAVIDVVLETGTGFDMYSYTDHEGERRWVSFGTEQKGTEGAEMMAGTLESYRLLAGDTDIE